MLIPSRACFDALPLFHRLGCVVCEGTYVATRHRKRDTWALYWMDSFWAEVHYDEVTNQLHSCCSFGKEEERQVYVAYGKTPE